MGDNSEIFVGKFLIWRVGDPEIFPYIKKRRRDQKTRYTYYYICVSF